jgi:protein-S-isoprenylcysteine O-methyltransferase Ste14
MINHFDLFGLRQVWLRYKETDYRDLPFTTAFAYKFIRHPLLLGFIVAFWAAPTMSMGHLIFALATTIYMLIAIQLEEKDMEGVFGDTYKAYKSQVPMLIPTGKTASPMTVSEPAAAPLEEPMAEEEAPPY